MDRSRRIALVTDSFAPRLDEVADTARHLADGLLRRGHRLVVVTGGPGASSYRGVPVVHTRRRVPTREVAAALDGFAPDTVVALAPQVLGGLALRHARRSGVPSVALDPVSLQERADITLASCRATRDVLTVAGLGPVLWQPGVALDEHRPDLRDPRLRAAWARGAGLVVGYGGGLDRHRVLGRLRRIARLDGVRLVVLGAGHGSEELLAAGARISTAVCGLDHARAVASVDVMVHARRKDPAVPEVRKALASGVPVVGYDAGGTADVVVDGYNGLLAASADEHGLTRAVAALRDDRALRDGLAASARPSVGHRDWDDAVAELLDRHLRPGAPIPA